MYKAQKVPLKASSCIEFARYEPRTQQLLVKFASNGQSYIYQEVPLEVVKQWVKVSRDGSSVGSWFITNIKPIYDCKKLVSPSSPTAVDAPRSAVVISIDKFLKKAR